jgi:rhamnosyltransferase
MTSSPVQPAALVPPIDRSTVWAAICTYRPDDRFREVLRRTVAALPRVIVVDDGSDPLRQDWIRGQVGQVRNLADTGTPICVDLLVHDNNRGIAAALNTAGRAAAQHGAQWMFCLDQDSLVPMDVLEQLATAMAQYPDPARVKLIGCNYRDETGQQAMPVSPGASWTDVPAVISSGSLVELATWRASGGFDESFIIDEVDHEYCLRLRSLGYRVVMATGVVLEHRLGQQERYRLGPWTFSMTHHPPLRRYYMTRNRLLIARRYLRTEPRWVLRSLVQWLAVMALVPFLERNGFLKLRAMFRGAWDGVCGRRGRAPVHMESKS